MDHKKQETASAQYSATPQDRLSTGATLGRETVDSTLSLYARQVVNSDSFCNHRDKVWTHD